MSMFKLFAIQNTSFYRFFSHTFFCISIIQQQSRLKFQNARKGIWKMVCQNKIVRKQSSKSILPKIISKILIMIHTSVVHIIQYSFQHKVNFSGKKGNHAICRFHFYSISLYSQVNHVALIYITLSPYHPVELLSLTANNRRDHPFIYSPTIIKLSVSVHLLQSCPGARLSYSQLTSRTRSHNLQISI